MSETDLYNVGTLVWAKMKGFPPWPGRVVSESKVKRPANKKNIQCVFFFGSNNYAWIEEVNIKPYHEFKEKFSNKIKSGSFKDAMAAIEKHIDDCAAGRFAEIEVEVGGEITDSDEDIPEKKEMVKTKPQKEKPVTKLKRVNYESNGTIVKKMRTTTSVLSPETSYGTSNHNPRKMGNVVSNFLDRPTGIVKPDIMPLDVEMVTQTLKEKNIQPSTLKFGFLGLGVMGSGIVKNLINSGHSVIVWNRSSEKCRDFIKAGAEQGMTPSDVIQVADITFSCVCDPQVGKEMVFGNCGVMQEMGSSKGYVEMTGIDAETSQDIAEAINVRGGRYLEAQIQGSKTQAEEGTLIILAAGDRSLFDDCQSCFQAMGKSSFYLGEVGNASKMNLVLQLMAGVTLAGVAEGMALADRAGLQQKDVMEILELTSLSCPAIIEKGRAIIEGGFSTHLKLKHMQKDLKLALSMGDQLEQPLPLSATANEVFKHAKRLGYGEHDVSSVYIRARF